VEPLLGPSIARALGSPIEVTLGQLLREYGISEGRDLLRGLADLSAIFGHYGLSCVPPMSQGGLDEPRILSLPPADSLEAVLAQIANLESADVEFKSSLELDHRRRANDPGRAMPDYRSTAVQKSALKTIAAFANSGGGTLYVGVEDDGTICGLIDDFGAVNAARPDYDGWDQHLRNLIGARFNDGAALNAYVHTQLFECDGRPFVRARVTSRQRLTFLKTGDAWELFIRTGTQTTSVPYCDIEQHYQLARLY
jgi:hypothetical protein